MQQQPNNTLAPEVQELWDRWCDGRIDHRIDHFHKELDEGLNLLIDDIGTRIGQSQVKIFELIEIVKELAVGNDFLSGRIAEISKNFRAQQYREEEMVEMRTIEDERISKVIRTIDSILAH